MAGASIANHRAASERSFRASQGQATYDGTAATGVQNVAIRRWVVGTHIYKTSPPFAWATGESVGSIRSLASVTMNCGRHGGRRSDVERKENSAHAVPAPSAR